MSLIRLDDEDRALELLLKRAKIISKVPGLKKEIAGNPDAVAAIMISNQQYGLGITIPAINMAFDWIEGTASPSALFYTAVGKIHGYYITPKERTREKAVAHVRHPSDPHDEPFDVEFGTAEAIDAHRLDEWVETRVETGRKYRDGNPVLERMVCTVTTNGVPVPLESLPVWAQELVDAGQVKRFDAWWNYRADMMWKSAAKRACRIACPDVLLGGGDSDHEGFSASGVRGSALSVEQDAAIEAHAYERPPADVHDLSDPDDDPGRPFE